MYIITLITLPTGRTHYGFCLIFMPNIKPISDLRNYTEVLKEAQEGAPVFLTKNGRGEYVILDMKEYDRMRATIALMSKLEEGEHSARKEGWLSADEVESSLGI